MDLSDIIKNDTDRLFIVDPECFIIFTGESSLEGKPFIRIGSWPEMPAALIPFIENIIVPDGMIGNPAFEQFNIDVHDLENNRYIGSEHILQRFLNYQKIFGLDLTNAIIVNIEKDIPELSGEKTVSEKNQFIGVFYRDGNFKTVHGSREIFDLKKAREMTLPFAGIHDLIVENSISTGRYNESGMVVIDNNPLFFNSGQFTSYLFPAPYLTAFSQLKISPEKIKGVIHPSGNFMNLTRFMKWKHHKTGQLTIVSDHNNEVATLKSLFRNCTVSQQSFDGMNYETADGTRYTQYRDSYNIRVDYRKKNLSIAFVKGSSGLRDVLQDDLDAIVIEYSVYEESTLLFKSSSIPVFLINDAGKKIDHLLNESLLLASPEIPYIFHKADSLEELLAAASLDAAAAEIFRDGDPGAIKNFLSALTAANAEIPQKSKTIHNCYNLLRAICDSTPDRQLFSSYRSMLQDLRNFLRIESETRQEGSVIRINFFNNGLYPFISETEEKPPVRLIEEIREDEEEKLHHEPVNPLQEKALNRIVSDRKRLRHLLEILLRERIEKGLIGDSDPARLAEAIAVRKNFYDIDIPEMGGHYDNTDSGSRLSSFIGGRKKNHSINDYEKPAAGESDSSIKSVLQSIPAGIKGPQKKFLTPGTKSKTDTETGTETGTGTESEISSEIREIKSTSGGAVPPAGKKRDLLHEGEDKALKWKKIVLPSLAAVLLLAPVLTLLIIKKGGNDSTSVISSISDPGDKTGKNKDKPVTRSREILTPEQKQHYTQLPERFKSKISHTDIYRYANRVAIKNGYAELKVTGIKIKNPHWIYPDNVFVLLDDQQVTVSDGDTLWSIAERKLIEMDIKFYDIIKRSRNESGRDREDLLKDAEKYSFSAKHKAILEEAAANQ